MQWQTKDHVCSDTGHILFDDVLLGKVKIVEPSISAEEMEVLKTSSDAQKEQVHCTC